MRAPTGSKITLQDMINSRGNQAKAGKQVQINIKAFGMDKSSHAVDKVLGPKARKKFLTVHLHSAYRGKFKAFMTTKLFTHLEG